ncbi:MAG: outer membrane protein assembly factor BamD [Candidatus Aquirickettsiella gammari]|uniref:Outer membrane protein assembly factor BamD n=1 Tax=Candidatus Aquirickettsiella gammari TaxID=2016198 RepID=A0A370CIS8_9COXI|nr:MAG: outer membrane protein assembly factor BamD [Candidatus Aquirickettsiella gammari]
MLFMLAACASHSNDPFIAFKGQPVGQVYQNAKTSLLDHNYSQAIKAYEALDVLYPFNRYSEQAQLELIYCSYQDGDSPSAKVAAERFIHLYPNSVHSDYAYYMQAVSDMDQDRGWYLRYIPIDLSLRYPGTMRLGYHEFAELINRYPNSRYAPDARQRMVYLRNLFASYELHIADYYFRRKAYVAAANRANEIIHHYQGAPEVQKALVIMIKAYRILGLEELARQSLAVFRLNYPDADYESI